MGKWPKGESFFSLKRWIVTIFTKELEVRLLTMSLIRFAHLSLLTLLYYVVSSYEVPKFSLLQFSKMAYTIIEHNNKYEIQNLISFAVKHKIRRSWVTEDRLRIFHYFIVYCVSGRLECGTHRWACALKIPLKLPKLPKLKHEEVLKSNL